LKSAEVKNLETVKNARYVYGFFSIITLSGKLQSYFAVVRIFAPYFLFLWECR